MKTKQAGGRAQAKGSRLTLAALRAWALAAGADYCGVADLAPARKAVLEQGGAAVAAFPRAVALGVALPNAVVDQLPRRHERAVAVNYRTHAYDVINARLDQMASHLGSLLQNRGHRALPLPAAERADDGRICAAFSHKLAAHLAGLGWIGKSCLLITPGHGPRVRWVTVLTDAPLPATGRAQPEKCGDCSACVDACPQRAFTGRPFRPQEPRAARYAAEKCDRFFTAMRKRSPWFVCGMCLWACPYGRNHSGASAK